MGDIFNPLTFQLVGLYILCYLLVKQRTDIVYNVSTILGVTKSGIHLLTSVDR
jgi:hypothetical protein